MWLAWGSVAGSALQFAVQIPAVLGVAPGLRPAVRLFSAEVLVVVRTFVPVFFSRGVVQMSAYVDAIIASLLPTGAVTGLANAQLLYTLPVSLFGMSVAVAELPAMSGEASAGHEDFGPLRARLDRGLRQIAYFVVPSAVVFLALGDVVAAALLQTGRFVYGDAVYVWLILAGAALGLLPATLGRLYSSAYYALARYAHAVSLRPRARRPGCGAWVRLRDPARDVGRSRGESGSRRTDGGGIAGSVGGTASAQAIIERPHRADRRYRSGFWPSCGVQRPLRRQ